MIVVVAAERYGLAQLASVARQGGARARRPRDAASWPRSDADGARSNACDVMRELPSGAEVAHADLRLRGPGDLLGARQTGALPLRFAEFIRDGRLIEQARAMAERWLGRDPTLELPESAGARAALLRLLDFGFSLGDVG